MKKVLSILCAFALITSMLTGCGTSRTVLNDAVSDFDVDDIVMFNYIHELRAFIMAAGTLKKFNNFQINYVPNMNGEHQIRSAETVAIRAGSQNKQNAWNFIKLMISEESQSRNNFDLIPVHKNSIYTQFGKILDSNYVYGDIARFSNEEIDTFISIITNVKAVSFLISIIGILYVSI